MSNSALLAATRRRTPNTSYANPGGTGDRTSIIATTAGASLIVGTVSSFVDGLFTNGRFYFNTRAMDIYNITFDFGTPKIIDEAKFYQQNSTAQGSWQWQVSSDGVSWTYISGIFNLGGIATQTITAISANINAYRYYRLLAEDNGSSNSPWVYQFEFKISDSGPTSYANPGGTGDRRSIITVTSNVANSPARLVDGDTTSNGRADFRTLSFGSFVSFDFGSSKLINEAKFYQQDTSAQGTWQWQGANDGVSWSNIGSSFSLGGTATQTITAISSNITQYRYYRVLGISGTTNNGPWTHQMEFKIS